jgi:hypothetical protein
MRQDNAEAVRWFEKAGVRWSHFVGQFGSTVKVYSVV